MGMPRRNRKRAPAFGRREQKRLAQIQPVTGESSEGKNKPPKDDRDALDIPNLPRGSMIPGINLAPRANVDPKLPGPEKRPAPQHKPEPGIIKEPKRKRRGSRAPGDDKLAAAAKPILVDDRFALPKQKPGETARDFARRVDEQTKKQLRGAQVKVNTEHMREKKRELAKAKKAKAAKKRIANGADQDGLFQRGERAAFADVAERPPILSSAAMKSRSKLKTKANVASAGVAGTTQTGGSASEFESYAAKVKDAYAAIKAKRLAARGAN